MPGTMPQAQWQLERERPQARRGCWRMLRDAVMALATLTLVVAIIAWQYFAWYVERPLQAPGTPLTACGTEIAPKYRKALPLLRSQLHAMMAESRIPGVAVAVAVRGRIVYRDGLGYADLAAKRPACPTTRFRVGSASQLFTALGMARLVEAGALDPDAPIQRYVPDFPRKGAPITPGLLASHRAGMRGFHDDLEAIDNTHYPDVHASLAHFASDPLVLRPGSDYEPSPYGYVLLSAAMERAARQDFAGYLRRAVFVPLRMERTLPDEGTGIPDRANPYDDAPPYSPDGRVVPSPPTDVSGRLAAAGYLSTAEDLARFASAHLARERGGPGLLRPASIERILRPRSGLPPLGGWGYGWMTMNDLHLRRVHFFLGKASGGTTVLAVYPGSGVVMAFLGNLGDARLSFAGLSNLPKPFLPFPRPDIVLLGGVLALVALVRAWRPVLRRR